MYKIYPRNKETTSKESKMFSTPFMARITNIVCPAAPEKVRMEYPSEIVIDELTQLTGPKIKGYDGDTYHEIIKLFFS